MIGASILLYSSYGGVLMKSKRIPVEEQYRLIMECRQSGLTDHQWCVEHDIKPGTFYNWVKRLRQKGCVDLPASTGRTYRAPESQDVVRVEFHDTDPIPYEQPLNVIPAATEGNNFSVAESMKLSVGSFHLTIPNGTVRHFSLQTIRQGPPASAASRLSCLPQRRSFLRHSTRFPACP
jgi:transposase-like protein